MTENINSTAPRLTVPVTVTANGVPSRPKLIALQTSDSELTARARRQRRERFHVTLT